MLGFAVYLAVGALRAYWQLQAGAPAVKVALVAVFWPFIIAAGIVESLLRGMLRR